MMSAKDGTALTVQQHIHQSINNIIITPIGTRLTMRDYGSLVPELLDQALSKGLTLQLQAAIVMALTQWEHRISLKSVSIGSETEAGAIAIITGTLIDSGQQAQFGINLGVA